MASPTPASTPPATAPLGFMARLNPNTLYFDPSIPHSPNDPRLILLLTWMDARDIHIAKYIAQYRLLFPTSRFLVIRSTLGLFMRPALRKKALRPAVEVLKECLGEVEGNGEGIADRGSDEIGAEGKENVNLLIHIFSNGGVSTSITLWDLLTHVPHHALIMDSCPGYFHWGRNHHAMTVGMPFWTSPLAHLLILTAWLFYIPWGHPAPQDSSAAGLNTAERMRSEVRRTYIYGTGDEAVDWRDVERHAAEAREVLGEEDGKVRLERFEEGRHVAHVRVDAERYWRVVKETWTGRQA
ncbi:Fc.00g030880.m01.CDS01 [Cosmosporella sp. VM-42]